MSLAMPATELLKACVFLKSQARWTFDMYILDHCGSNKVRVLRVYVQVCMCIYIYVTINHYIYNDIYIYYNQYNII